MAENSGEMTEDDYIINDQDGLPNVHPNLLAEADIDSPDPASDDEFDDLPTSLIVTNIQDNVFETPGKKSKLPSQNSHYCPHREEAGIGEFISHIRLWSDVSMASQF